MKSRYLLPVGLFLIAMVSFGTAGFSIWGLFTREGTSFMGPGVATVQVSKPGTYTLYHETRTMRDGKVLSFSDDLPSGSTFRITNAITGAAIELQPGASERMEMNNVERVAIGKLEFPKAGNYSITVSGLSEQRPFYVAEARILEAFLGFFGGLFFGLTCLAAAVGVLIYQLARRRRAPLESLRPVG